MDFITQRLNNTLNETEEQREPYNDYTVHDQKVSYHQPNFYVHPASHDVDSATCVPPFSVFQSFLTSEGIFQLRKTFFR